MRRLRRLRHGAGARVRHLVDHRGTRTGRRSARGLSFTDPYSGFLGGGRRADGAAHYRRRTGKGQYIDLSEQEAAIPHHGRGAAGVPDDRARERSRHGDRSEWAAPQGCYRCAGDDRWAVISCSNDAEFERMAAGDGRRRVA